VAGRRIVSLWFPRLAAERWMRRAPELGAGAFAVVAAARGALTLASLSPAAEAAGLRRGMSLADARAIAPGLVTRPADPLREGDFLAALGRWAERFSPWVAVEAGDPAEGLVLDVTGCAHLFGGEAGLVAAALEGAAAWG
jgi:protein ImuB